VRAEDVTSSALAGLKQEGFGAVAVVLDEQSTDDAYRSLGDPLQKASLDLYYWIEVGRNPLMAAEHPRWMAALGMHDDWLRNFPNLQKPPADQVAKAYPWVPIVYQEAFSAHLQRVERLLKRAQGQWRGLLLNDLQAGPSSCGCGNLQCRWAVDYRVTSTAAPITQPDTAARFLSEVRKSLGDHLLVPVWTTECEQVDLPAGKLHGRPGTGFCGDVSCAITSCPVEFGRQWAALTVAQDSPIALLAMESPLHRTDAQFGGGFGWVTNVLAYVNEIDRSQHRKALAPEHMWVVVDGQNPAQETSARQVAAQSSVGAIIVARTKIDQSYEPRIIPAE
jgi:hypothetical protein